MDMLYPNVVSILLIYIQYFIIVAFGYKLPIHTLVTFTFYSTVKGHTQGFCIMCELERHVKRVLASPRQILAPKSLVYKLRCKHSIKLFNHNAFFNHYHNIYFKNNITVNAYLNYYHNTYLI